MKNKKQSLRGEFKDFIDEFKKAPRKRKINLASFIVMVFSGLFIFFELIAVVPLTLILAAAILFYHSGSTEVLYDIPSFLNFYFSVVTLFILSTIVFLLTKFITIKKK